MDRLMFLGFLLATATAHAHGTLQLGGHTVEDSTITVPVILGGELGDGVAAMDFRFLYNPDAVQPVSFRPGAAASVADKRVLSSQVAPGEYTVVMMGLNQTSCGPGEAIEIVLHRLHGEDGNWLLGLSDPTMSSVEGMVIDSRVLSGVGHEDDSAQEEAPVSSPDAPDARPGQYAHAGPPGGVLPSDGADATETPEEPAGQAVGTDLADRQAAETLREAIGSAYEARALIDSPPDRAGEPGDLADAPVDPGVAREDTAILISPGVEAEGPALDATTVETQAIGASLTDAPQTKGGKFAFYGVAFLVFVALMAALFTRRSRLKN